MAVTTARCVLPKAVIATAFGSSDVAASSSASAIPTTAAAALASTRLITGFGPPKRSPTENIIAISLSPT
jgi:hypothetical protein